MSIELLKYIDPLFKLLASITAVVAILQLLEVRKRRLIDMYWKIFEMYSSEDQKSARRNIFLLNKVFIEKMKEPVGEKELAQFYSSTYHNTTIEENKLKDNSMLNRLRFLNQIGVLLKRKLIDKDMLFALIGIGLEHDYSTMKIILETHRINHKTPNLYSEIETTLTEYQKWKIKKNKNNS